MSPNRLRRASLIAGSLLLGGAVLLPAAPRRQAPLSLQRVWSQALGEAPISLALDDENHPVERRHGPMSKPAPRLKLEDVKQVRVLHGAHVPRKVLMVLSSWTRDEVQQMLEILREINVSEALTKQDRLSLFLLVEDDYLVDELDLRDPSLAELVEVDTEYSTNDLWLQDWGELVALQRTDQSMWRLGVLDCGRDRGLAGLPDHLAGRWSGTLVRVSEGKDGGDYGGNIESTPDGLLVLGTTTSVELREFFARTGYADRMALVETGWLDVGHADEHLAFLPAQNDLGYVVIRSDPALGLSLLEKLEPAEIERNLAGLVNAALRSRDRFPVLEQDGAETWALLQRIATLMDIRFLGGKPPPDVPGRDQDQQPETRPPSLEQVRASCEQAAAFIDANTEVIVEAIHHYRKDTTLQVPLIRFPTLFYETANGTLRPVLPETVNLLVLRDHVVVPDPLLPVFREWIRLALEEQGYTPHFLSSVTYHEGQGQVHCATNVLRDPRRTLGAPAPGNPHPTRTPRRWGD